MQQCPLCTGEASQFYQDQRNFYQCSNCQGVFDDPTQHPSGSQEHARYETHNNDVNDPGYQQFVSPITNHVLQHFKPTDSGLDFGAGPGPVITKLLNEQGYNPALYDPFYAPDPLVLEKKRDYIICCEVIEHFHHPINKCMIHHHLPE